MDINLLDLAEILLTLGLYFFLGWVFIQYILFLMRMVAPKVMTGSMDIRGYISLFGGSLMVLFLMAFGPYYMGQAVLYGWNSFKPIIITISEDIISDFGSITDGGSATVNVEPVQPIEQPAVPPVPQPTAVPVVPTVPTPTPFNMDTWTPDQPPPTPGGN